MKVAYLLGSLNRGGAENLILDVFNNSDKAKFDIMGISRKSGCYLDSFLRTSNIFIQCPISHHNIVSYILKLRHILKANNVTIVHAQLTIDAVFARIATIGTNIKVVLTFHGFDFGFRGTSLLLLKMGLRLSDAVCFVSQFQHDYYKKRYKFNDKVQHLTIHNGINFSKITLNEKQQTNKRIRLGMVGSFAKIRDQFFICKFLYNLKQKGIDFDFNFIGSKLSSCPECYDKCLDFCESHNLMGNVHFLGGCDNVPSLLAEMDAFIYCSDHDTFGIAVIEAISSGIPVFVNDWAVMSEITENGQYATLYKTGDLDDLDNKFMTFLQHPDETIKRAKENAMAIREKFSITTHINNLYELYKKLE